MAYRCLCGNGDSDGMCNGSCLAVDAELGECHREDDDERAIEEDSECDEPCETE